MPAHATYDAVIVGGGHNGLVAAAYLARAGRSVLVLERLATTGGAAVSTRPFPGVDARLSRYSYLCPCCRGRSSPIWGCGSRCGAGPSPRTHRTATAGLLVGDGAHACGSFAGLTGGDSEYVAWQQFYGATARVAERIFPTLTEPLPTRAELRERGRRRGFLADAVRGADRRRRSSSASTTTWCAESSSPTR